MTKHELGFWISKTATDLEVNDTIIITFYFSECSNVGAKKNNYLIFT